eukprot:g34150.t1
MNQAGGWKEGGGTGKGAGGRVGTLFEIGELRVESSELYSAQVEDKVLFLKFASRVTATLEEAKDRHVGGGLGWGVEMGSDWEVRLVVTGQLEMLGKTVT